VCVDDVFSGSLVGEFQSDRYLSPAVDVVIVSWLQVLLNFRLWEPGGYDLFNFCCTRDLFDFDFAAAFITRV
jgi:hypothetical protein